MWIREKRQPAPTAKAFHRWNKSDGWLVTSLTQHTDIFITPTTVGRVEAFAVRDLTPMLFHIWMLPLLFCSSPSRPWPPQAAPPPTPAASLRAAAKPTWTHLCVDSNSVPFDLCGGTERRHAARLALLLAVCYPSVIPKQALSLRCLLIHLPRGVQEQVAALTVNVFPKIPATASHLHPYMYTHTHTYTHDTVSVAQILVFD